MPVADFELHKYVSDSHRIAERLIKEAESLLEHDGQAAALRCVEGWLILNGAAVTATRIEAGTLLKKVKYTRNKIRAMSHALAATGFNLVLDIPETSMAFVVAAKEKSRD